ncbi:MAG: hypothetical protein KJ624_03815 [Chloroflexi bacterium]|nr:hypothetical protein [Chloroflexota bacterium]
MMLLMDGVKYEEWIPPDEEALEEVVKEHHEDIFGEGSLYFDIKSKISGSSVASIPDGYAIRFEPDQWWVVEVELSTHDVYGHIQPQIGKFLAAVGKLETRAELKKKLYGEIVADEQVKADLQGRKGGEIFKLLSDLLDQPPKVAVIIDSEAPALADLSLSVPPEVVEFRTFRRAGAGAPAHIHQFEPLVTPSRVQCPPAPFDTIVVPAQEEGFLETFLGEDRWYAVRVSERKIPSIKYIAVYRVAPVSAITHWAPVRSVEPWPEERGKFVVNFAEKAREIAPIKAAIGGKVKKLQSPAYAVLKRLLKAENLDDVFG